jgi:hypothetical protein
VIDKNLQVISPVAHGTQLDGDEPSHIHIARPGRALRRENPGSAVAPADKVRDLATTEISVEAA